MLQLVLLRDQRWRSLAPGFRQLDAGEAASELPRMRSLQRMDADDRSAAVPVVLRFGGRAGFLRDAAVFTPVVACGRNAESPRLFQLYRGVDEF